ncbi:MAG TPA: hypothetical protein VMZ91_14740 [Candidatus Paceibacterota bacterium]|nr:hypothetical protein [Candidatus Paceibacterota bacterium]
MTKGKAILRTDIVREKGKLYYCATDDKGCILVCESPMSHGRKKKTKKK